MTASTENRFKKAVRKLYFQPVNSTFRNICDRAMTEIIKPGTCIQLNEKSGSKFDLQFGLIKKYLPEQKKYRVMLGHEKSDIAISSTKFKIVQQCQNETRENRTGYLLWPTIPKNDQPSVQWFEAGDLSRFYKDWENEIKVLQKQGKPWMPPNHGSSPRFVNFCTKHLGWKAENIQCRRSWCFKSPTNDHREMFVVLFDSKNQTKSNVWYEKCFQPFLTNDMVVKGPMVVFRWFNKNKPSFEVSLNFHKSNMLGIVDYVANPPVKEKYGPDLSGLMFMSKELERYSKSSNHKSPDMCCVVKDCKCSIIIASGDKKFLQEEALVDRITAQFDRFEGLRAKGGRHTVGVPGQDGLQGIQQVFKDPRTGQTIDPNQCPVQ